MNLKKEFNSNKINNNTTTKNYTYNKSKISNNKTNNNYTNNSNINIDEKKLILNDDINNFNTKDINDIKKLQLIIEEQRKKINELKLEKNNLICILDKKDLLIKKLNNDIDFINNKFLSTQESFKLEKEQLNKKFELEKEKIKNEYEQYITKLKNEYNNKY